MKYQNDAHHYRKVVRRRKNFKRIKGISLIVVAVGLMFYAVPCFAVSVFDYGQPEKPSSSTSFSSEISDYATAEEATAAAVVKGAEVSQSTNGAAENEAATQEADSDGRVAAYAVSDYSLISNTTGPGALANEAAVAAARTRSEAFAAIASGDASKASGSALAMFSGAVPAATDTTAANHVDPIDLIFASIALIMGIVCATLGIRMIVRSRHIRGMQIAAAYGQALRAW